MQIKTTVKYHLTPVRMTIFNKSTKEVLAWMWGNADWCSHCGKQYGVTSKN